MPDHRSSPPSDPAQLDPELHLTARPTARFWRGLWEYARTVVDLDEEALEQRRVPDPTGEPPRDELAELVALQRRRDEQLIAEHRRGKHPMCGRCDEWVGAANWASTTTACGLSWQRVARQGDPDPAPARPSRDRERDRAVVVVGVGAVQGRHRTVGVARRGRNERPSRGHGQHRTSRPCPLEAHRRASLRSCDGLARPPSVRPTVPVGRCVSPE